MVRAMSFNNRHRTSISSLVERYLSTPAQLDHSCQLLLDSDFFAFHSDRSCDLLLQEAKVQTDPHILFMLYSIFLARGRRHYPFFRAQTLWEPIFPLLMDHVIFEALGDTTSDYIESKLRYLAIEMLFELCRLQKLSASQLSAWSCASYTSNYSSNSLTRLGVFTDTFIDDLFDLVENSRSNEMLSYSVIRFLVRVSILPCPAYLTRLLEGLLERAIHGCICEIFASRYPSEEPRRNCRIRQPGSQSSHEKTAR